MRACFHTFGAGIKELQDFLTDAENEAALIGLLLRPAREPALEPQEKQLLAALARTRTDRKRYVYSVAIVSLYGLLERFVDTLIERFVDRTAGFASTYEKIPEIIRRHHVALSMDLVKAIIEDRYKGDSTQNEVIANLHSCLSGEKNFRMNGSAFVLHRGNISLDRITAFLSSVGISAHLRKATLTTALSRFLTERDPQWNVREIPDQELSRVLAPIDDLVERRNQVSHGVVNVDEIESIDLLRERCRFVAAYGAALYEILWQDILPYLVTGMIWVQALGRPVAVYNNSIVCFEGKKLYMQVGDFLVASTGDALMPFRFSPISSIEINHVRHDSINLVETTKFGVQISFRARETFDYFVLPHGIPL